MEFIARSLSPYRFNFLTHYQNFPKRLSISSVAESCPILWDSMDQNMPGLLSITNSRSLLKLMSIKSVMPSNHLFLCCPLLHLPSIFPSSRIFSSESALYIKMAKRLERQLQHQSLQWIFRVSFRIDWFDLIFLWKVGREQGVLFSWGFTGICHRENAATSRNRAEENLWRG